jgi:shikimate kinase
MPTFRTSRRGSAADASRPHVILVGLPGSGKSTVGQAVASNLGRAFLDLDDEIEAREGRSIAELFAVKGEPYFRGLELSLTEELKATGNMILAPGGGWITQAEAVGLLRPPGRLIYLRVRPEAALERLGPERASRPLLREGNPLGRIQQLLLVRQAAYETADAVVDTELFDIQGVIERVAELASEGG